jgi:two-component system heavy metal sensor histidine kinase CusS
LLVAAALFYFSLLASLRHETEDLLGEHIELLRAHLHDSPKDIAELRQVVEVEPRARKSHHLLTRVIASDGRIVAQTPGMSALLPMGAITLPPDPEPPFDTQEMVSPTAEGRAYRVTSAAAGGYVIQVALDLYSEQRLLGKYRQRAAVVLGVGLAGCVIVSYLLARRAIQPVEHIAGVIGHIQSSTLSQRIDTAGLPAEIATLADSFNGMLSRIEDAFTGLSRFSADIAHELRSPIAILRGEMEVSLRRARSAEEYRKVLESCLEECVYFSDLIDRLLFLARADNDQTKLHREPLDLGQELEKVREFYEPSAAEKNISLKLEADGEVLALLDRTLFQSAVGNLVENAMAHTPPGGSVTLSTKRAGDAARVEITDTGCGIATEDLPYICDRFYRADKSRARGGGHLGLGLALVKSIATLHGGTLSFDSRQGAGTRAILSFPSSA